MLRVIYKQGRRSRRENKLSEAEYRAQVDEIKRKIIEDNNRKIRNNDTNNPKKLAMAANPDRDRRR